MGSMNPKVLEYSHLQSKSNRKNNLFQKITFFTDI